MFIFNSIIYLFSFFLIWLGAGLIVSSADRVSKKLKISSFAFSFFVLGILTSIPEFGIGMTAISEGKPGIFVGNLIGGILAIFILIIPILSIMGNGIKLNHKFSVKKLLFAFAVMIAPSIFVIDGNITKIEGIIMILMYAGLFYFIEREKKGVLDTKNTSVLDLKVYSFKDLVKVLIGIALVFISSHLIVDNTLYFAEFFQVSPFYISLILLSIGTNLPELSLAVRSVMLKKEDVAFGDYVGSGAANAFLFGVFTILNPSQILTEGNYIITFLITGLAFLLVFYFLSSKNDISRREGILLLMLYIFFVIIEGI